MGARTEKIKAWPEIRLLLFPTYGPARNYSLVAENEDGPFRQLYEVEFGAGPIGLLRVKATTDGSRTSVETLWQDLSIRAQELQAADIPLFRKRPAAKPTE